MKERMTKEKRAEMVRIAVTTQDRAEYDRVMGELGYRHADTLVRAAKKMGVNNG